MFKFTFVFANVNLNKNKKVLYCLYILHDNDIIHQDINKDNIMYSSVGDRFILIDFGTVARENNKEDQIHFLTAGKEFYKFLLAPEHSKGNPTTQSDLYSLGKLIRERIEYNNKKGTKSRFQKSIDFCFRICAGTKT